MSVMQRKLIQDGDLRLWKLEGNKGDYINAFIPTDTPIDKIAHVNMWVSGGFDITRTDGNLPDVPKLRSTSPYCSFKKDLPFNVVNKGKLTFTANQDNSAWYCINHFQYKLLTGESYEIKAGESVTIPANNFVFIAIGEVDGLSSLRIHSLDSEKTLTAIIDCMIVRIDNVQLEA